MTLTTTHPIRAVTIGVDTHQLVHHAAAVDQDGRMLGDRAFPADRDGYQQLLDWAASFGIINAFGVECTGSYGAGLTRHLIAAGLDVVEINRGHSQVRHRVGKSDAVDAEAAARKVLSGECSDPAKDTTGTVEAIRNLHLVRDSAIKARSAACVQLRDVLLTAPDHLRNRLTAKTLEGKATQARTLRPDLSRIHEPEQAVKYALRDLGRRIYDLTAEINEADKHLTRLVSAVAPNTLALPQVGPVSVAQLLITAGENFERFRNEAAFARLCGVAPIPVSSGKSNRMRLHRGGNRQANRVIYLIAICRLRYDPRSKAYRDRKRAQGHSSADAIRCLKRFIAREIYYSLKRDLSTTG
ncbi:IS110 family transposase [Pseudarthrobacter scleromae]|uniref:IS110 family transposase n=1 Tax=Pseudarthrobacter scleromae TaxID=158897 RepID=UPI003D06FEC4